MLAEAAATVAMRMIEAGCRMQAITWSASQSVRRSRDVTRRIPGDAVVNHLRKDSRKAGRVPPN
jgi:hypothetical protein